jgi:hypothetical protein
MYILAPVPTSRVKFGIAMLGFNPTYKSGRMVCKFAKQMSSFAYLRDITL